MKGFFFFFFSRERYTMIQIYKDAIEQSNYFFYRRVTSLD